MVIKEVESRRAPINSLEVSKLNVRKTINKDELLDLANSIREIGVQQPLVTRQLPDQRFEIIIGQRRYEASKIAGVQEVPIVVIEATDKECLLASFSENIHRAELTYEDKTIAAQDLMKEYNGNEETVATRLGVSRQTLRNYLGWAVVPNVVKQMVDHKRLSRDSAIRISRSIDDANKIISIAERIIETSQGELKNEIVKAAVSSPSDTVDEIYRNARAAQVRQLNIQLDSRLAELLEKASKEFDKDKASIVEEALIEWFRKREMLTV